MAIKLSLESFPKHKFDALEIHPCREFNKDTKDAFVEQCEDEEAEFWSVYVHYDSKENKEGFGGLECIADCDTEGEAIGLTVFLNHFAEQYKLQK